jgi:hypothetical protein
MADRPSIPRPEAQFTEAEQLTVVSYRKRQLVMYPVQRTEFEILASGYSSVHLGLAAGCFGAGITLAATIASVNLSEPMGTRFWSGLLILGIATLYFGFMAGRDYFKSKRVIATIKSETVDVVVGEVKQ